MDNQEHFCDMCKVAYATDSELQDHNWSLMHHIKIEKTKKGAPHSCNLCMVSCANIIEYGKHLNEDRHKLALSRRSKNGEDEMLDSFSQADSFGRDNLDVTVMQIDPKVQGHLRGQEYNVPVTKHSRSLSQPELYSKPGSNMKRNKFQWSQSNMQPENSLLRSGDRFWRSGQHGYNQGQNPDEGQNNDIGEGFPERMSIQERLIRNSQMSFHDNFGNKDYAQDDFQNLNWQDNNFYSWNENVNRPYSNGIEDSHWDGNHPKRHDKGHRRGSFDSSFQRPSFSRENVHRHENENFELSRDNGDRTMDERPSRDVDEGRGRGILRSGRGRTRSCDPHMASKPDKYSPESNSSTDSNGLKRRLEDDHRLGPGKSRRGNGNNRITQESRSRSKSPIFHSEPSLNLLEDRGRRRPNSRSLSRDRFPESNLTLESDLSYQSQSRRVTWSDQQLVSSTTGPDLDGENPERSRSLERRNRFKKDSVIPDSSTGNKKVPKKKGKVDKRNYSPLGSSPGRKKTQNKHASDNTESVLAKAEKLCKKLRTDREKSKQQRLVKDKLKKMERTEELNSQIEELSRKNKENIKGHLDCLDTVSLNSSRHSDSSSISKENTARTFDVLEKAAVSLGISTPEQKTTSSSKDQSYRLSVAGADASTSKPSVADRINQTKDEINKIRAKIEGSVNFEMGSVVKGMGCKVSPRSSKKPDQNSLLKMVNSPRSTKERLQLAEMLRSHAKSQTKLSLPRFNLKFSDLCTGSDRQDEIADIDLETLAPSIQLQIANLIEADVKPDVTELEKLLDKASAENSELDLNILNELGLLQTPTKSEIIGIGRSSPVMRMGSPSVTPSLVSQRNLNDLNLMRERSRSPISANRDTTRTEDYVADGRPSLSIEELVTEVGRAKEQLLNVRERDRELSSTIQPNMNTHQTHSSRFPSSLPESSTLTGGATNMSTFDNLAGAESPSFKIKTENIPSPDVTGHLGVRIKQEKIDAGYEQAAENISVASRYDPASYEVTQRDQGGNLYRPDRSSGGVSENYTGRVSPIRRSIHTQNLHANIDELPVRDTEKSSTVASQNDNRTTLEKVNSILDGAPNMEKVLYGAENSSLAAYDRPQPPVHDKDKQLDSSMTSQTSSVLDQVYNISLQEENVRQDITVADVKINQLKKLIDEASEQLNKFTNQRKELLEKEHGYRNTRMRLLQESRSLQGSTSSQTGSNNNLAPLLPNLTEAQLQNLNNPVFVKFLMSQRQSDQSSVGGYSIVETGSQSELDQMDRRSVTSTLSEHITNSRKGTTQPREAEMNINDRQIFSRSIDILSGSTETISSFKSNTQNERDNATPVPGEFAEKQEPLPTQGQDDEPTSFSLLNKPLEKSGFVTLEALMKGDTDIGKLLQKSLESIGKGTIPEGASPLQKQDSNDSRQSRTSSGLSLPLGRRERSDSIFSIGSDDIMSGSDIDKRSGSGKVSMKYMGSIPDGVKYDTFVKQLSMDNKSKPLTFTVLSSPEVMSQLKKVSDSGLGTSSLSSQLTPATNTDVSKNIMGDFGIKSDRSNKSYNSTSTLTVDMNDIDSQSIKSGFSLGEQITRMCNGQNAEQILDIQTPRSESSGDKTLEDETGKATGEAGAADITAGSSSPIKDCYVKLEELDPSDYPHLQLLLDSKMDTSKLMTTQEAAASPTRKRLKSKKERDQLSRRKQKESFILRSDSEGEEKDTSFSAYKVKHPNKTTTPTKSEEELVQTGSEGVPTPRVPNVTVTSAASSLLPMSSGNKKCLLDDVQLETETPSDSCEDRSQRSGKSKQGDDQRLKFTPEKLESFRANVKTKLNKDSGISSIKYEGPSISVATMQVFKGELFVCYNGSEIRRFDLATGQILKELDCAPFLVNSLHVTSVENREDILYTGGACKKLMLFKPQKFNLIETFNYSARIVCLCENWGRLFVGLSDGCVSVRSVKTDKELNIFSCTASSVSCMDTTSAGMTKMLCLGTTDKIIYVLDAITGLLITMLAGHSQPPLSLKIFGETVLSGAADQTMLVHNASTGDRVKTVNCTKAISHIWTDNSCIYTTCCDNLIQCYDSNFKLSKVCYGAGKCIVTYGLVHDDMMITGNREGLVEAIPLSYLTGKFPCKFGKCSLEFTMFEYLKHHVLTDHNHICSAQCTYKTCGLKLATKGDGKDQVLKNL